MRGSSGVSTVVGFILLLQILIIFLAFVQTTIIPDQLKKIESDNVKSVKNEIEKFSALTLSGDRAYMLIKTPSYPDYLFLLTPEPAGFSVHTEPFKINVTFDAFLPNGSKIRIEREYESNRIYVNITNYFYPDTTFVVENTAVFQRSDGGTGVAVEQQMVKNGVNLVILKGNLSSAYNSPKEFVFQSISSGGRIYAENISIEFKSIKPDYWGSLGYTVNGENVRINISSGFFSVNVLSLESMSQLPSMMIKTNSFDTYTLSTGDVIELGVQILDRYLNPVSGVNVNVSKSNDIGSLTPSTLKTDANGRAVVSFRATKIGSCDITFTSGSLTARYSINVVSTNISSGGILQVSWLNSSGTWDARKDGSRKILAVRVTDASSNPVPNVNVNFFTSNTSVIELNRSIATTNSNGIAFVEAAAKANGSARIYAFAGDAGDVIELTVINATGLWLSGWSYRIPIYIKENSGSDLNDYQVLIQLDGSFNWSAVKSDGSDIRFTDVANNPLNYWIEEWNYGSSARIWVKVSLQANENKTLYMYYGNSSATSQSNGTRVFVFFDDFNGADLNTTVWAKYTDKYDVKNSRVKIKKGGIELVSPLSFNLQDGYSVDAKVRYTNKNKKYGGVIPLIASSSYVERLDNDIQSAVIYMRDSNSRNVHYWIGDGCNDGYEYSDLLAWTSQDNNWYTTGISVYSDKVKLWKDYTVVESISGISWCNNMNYIKLGSYLRDSKYDIQDTEYDWVRVRKYIEPEPSVTLGNEEKV